MSRLRVYPIVEGDGDARAVPILLRRIWTEVLGGEHLEPSLILVLLDADEDPSCILGPELLDRAKRLRGDADISCVIADVDYETWFVAAAPSLARFFSLPPASDLPETPEQTRRGKGKGEEVHAKSLEGESVDRSSRGDCRLGAGQTAVMPWDAGRRPREAGARASLRAPLARFSCQ